MNITDYPEYVSFKNAQARCTRPQHKDYKDYGARGVTFSDEWSRREGFRAFIEHIGRRPTPLHTIERIDNDKGYEPGNVRWATRKEQCVNRRVRADNRVGVKGVFWKENRQRWASTYWVDGKKKVHFFREREDAIARQLSYN